jgi:hypothetical protein
MMISGSWRRNDRRYAAKVVDVLHGILSGEDAHLRTVQLHQAGVEGGRLARPGRPRHEEDAGGAPEQLVETAGHDRRKVEAGDGAGSPRLVQDADDHAVPRVARDDRDAQVDGDLAPRAIDRHLKAAVLGPPALRDVELAQNADARGDLPHVLIEIVLELAEVGLAQHSVDAIAYVETRGQHLEVDVAAVALEGPEENLPDEVVGAPGRSIVDGALHAHHRPGVYRRIHGGSLVGADVLNAALRLVFIETTERALDGPARGGDHGDAKARELHQLVDHGHRSGIVHGHGERATHLGDGENGMAARVAPVDHPGEPAIDGHLLQVDEGNPQLLAQGLPHRLVGDVVELEEDLAEGKLETLLLGEGVLELGLGDRPVGEENLPQAVTRRGRVGHGSLQRTAGASGGPRP